MFLYYSQPYGTFLFFYFLPVIAILAIHTFPNRLTIGVVAVSLPRPRSFYISAAAQAADIGAGTIKQYGIRVRIRRRSICCDLPSERIPSQIKYGIYISVHPDFPRITILGQFHSVFRKQS